MERKAPVNLCNLQKDQSGDVRPGARATGAMGSVCVPMMAGDRAVGALGIAMTGERDFTEPEVARHSSKQERCSRDTFGLRPET